MRAKDVNESVIQMPFTNNTRNQAISGSYPLSMMQYEDADKDEHNPDYEELHKEDRDFELADQKFQEEVQNLKLTEDDFKNAQPGDVFYGFNRASNRIFKITVEKVEPYRYQRPGRGKYPPQITIVSKGNHRYIVGELLSSKPTLTADPPSRGIMDPRNFKGNDYHSSYEKYKAKYENKTEDMRAREVNEDWESDMKAKEKVWNAEYRAADKARNETYKTMKKAYVLPIGIVSPSSGKTMYEWNIYDSWPDGWAFLYGGAGGDCLVFSSDEHDFEIGEDLILYGNDTGRRLTYASKVKDKAPVKKEELVDMLYKHGYDYKPKRAFQPSSGKRRLGGPAKLATSYSVKGITYDEIKPHKRQSRQW